MNQSIRKSLKTFLSTFVTLTCLTWFLRGCCQNGYFIDIYCQCDLIFFWCFFSLNWTTSTNHKPKTVFTKTYLVQSWILLQKQFFTQLFFEILKLIFEFRFCFWFNIFFLLIICQVSLLVIYWRLRKKQLETKIKAKILGKTTIEQLNLKLRNSNIYFSWKKYSTIAKITLN